MRQIHAYWDARGMTHSDPQALPKAIHAITLPERFKLMDTRALGKVYRRARERLPLQYDRWISLVEKWDKSYDRQKARKLVDALVTGLGNRPSRILNKLFDHLEQQYCENWKKKVQRLEAECERLESDEYHMPKFRELKRDDLRGQVYAALADGPKTKKQLARRFRRTSNAILAVGQHLRDAGLIETVSVSGRFMLARVGTAPSFVVARDAIVTSLKEGPMSVPELAKKTGKSKVTIFLALQSRLLPNKVVIRTKRGVYALPGIERPYIRKYDAIIAALSEGPMTLSELTHATWTPYGSLHQFIRPLLAKRSVIRTKRGVYALPGAAPVFVTTDDVIIRALRKRPMKLRTLAEHINKPPTTILSALARLKTAGKIKPHKWGAEYHLARQVPRSSSTQYRRRNPAAGLQKFVTLYAALFRADLVAHFRLKLPWVSKTMNPVSWRTLNASTAASLPILSAFAASRTEKEIFSLLLPTPAYRDEHEWLAKRLNELHRVLAPRIRTLDPDSWRPESQAQ